MFLCIWAHQCVYVCVYVCVCVKRSVYIRDSMRVCVYVCVCVNVFVYLWTSGVWVSMWWGEREGVFMYASVFQWVWMRVRVNVRMYDSLSVCLTDSMTGYASAGRVTVHGSGRVSYRSVKAPWHRCRESLALMPCSCDQHFLGPQEGIPPGSHLLQQVSVYRQALLFGRMPTRPKAFLNRRTCMGSGPALSK